MAGTNDTPRNEDVGTYVFTYCCIMGARKLAGKDLLPFVTADGTKPYARIKETCVETYLAFISDDGEAISNSVYTAG